MLGQNRKTVDKRRREEKKGGGGGKRTVEEMTRVKGYDELMAHVSGEKTYGWVAHSLSVLPLGSCHVFSSHPLLHILPKLWIPCNPGFHSGRFFFCFYSFLFFSLNKTHSICTPKILNISTY